MAPKAIKNVPENTQDPPTETQSGASPMEGVTSTSQGETPSNPSPTLVQAPPAQAQDSAPQDLPAPSASSISNVSSSDYPVDEEEKLRQALADASAVRFLQDDATPEVRLSSS
ncbi:predicted protein [Lichtheimia corymbifera JMRC:FSU:9682]|uniref:Uncharacterized protein n=1 Tax=Lichtheimia corymbifera JMRC:FSU:9682 TaxID=1263082 RepID=A0A068SIZ8_9FUNG|nr:predicted protein [Lichtheimia corymbifera JMRC:FSU:9682]